MLKIISTSTICLFAVIAFVSKLSAQDETNWQEQAVEYIESRFSEDSKPDIEQLLEDLQFFANNPLNVNLANSDEFGKLYFLDPVQIQNLIYYREENGQILSPFELKAIDGFNQKLIQLISNFLSFDREDSQSISYLSRQEIMIRGTQLIEKQKGFKEPRKYEGSRLKLYSRYRIDSKNVKAGFTMEKDAGESFFKNSNSSGFDFYSGFATIPFSKSKNHIFLGDYRLQFGQGLTAWQGFSLGKSIDINAGAKFNQGIKAYTSTNENFFMRGVAASVKLGKFTVYPFFSTKKFDANTDSINGRAIFTSFQTTGLHRTTHEIEDKNSVRELAFGSYLSYSGKFYTIGLSGLQVNYQLPLKRKEANYNQFLFEGKQIRNYSLDYRIGLNKYFLFGEIASCSTNGSAFIGGVLAKPFDKIEFSAIARNISKKYNAPFGNAFTENSKLNDEQGIYFGIKVHPLPKISLQGYVDYFKYKWIKYTTAAPGNGQELQLQANYQLFSKWNIYCRYSYELKPLKTTFHSLKINLDQTREKLRLHLNGEINENLFLKSRIELSFYKHDHNSTGLLAFQDFGFHSKNQKLKYWIRLSYFKTDDYDSRIYAYENDLLYQFSIPAFYGEGIRSYLNGKVKICEKTDLWFKASRSWFIGAESLGSGYSLIEGNTRTEVKMQLRFRF